MLGSLIFFIHQDGCIKINTTADLESKLLEIAEETGKPFKFLGAASGDENEIQEIQNKFKYCHIKDDWYRNNTELSEWIEQNATLERNKPLGWTELINKYVTGQDSTQVDECKKLIELADKPLPPKMERLISIDEAAAMLGISPQTLRNWEEKGTIVPQRTAKGHRRYTTSQLNEIRKQQMKEEQFFLPNITTSYILQTIQDFISPFDPFEPVNLTITKDNVAKKVKFTIDTIDGKDSRTKSFNIKE